MDYKKNKNKKDIKEDKTNCGKAIDSMIKFIDMILNVGVDLVTLFVIIYKFIARHTFLISVIVIVLGSIYLIN